MAASLNCCCRPRLPLGGGVQSISGSNQIDNGPRCFRLLLEDDQFLVLYLVGAQLLMLSAITLDSYSESYQPICAIKQLDANINWGASGAFYLNSFCRVWMLSAQFSEQTATCTRCRYSISLNSIINTANEGVTFIPGNNTGLSSAGAQYT